MPPRATKAITSLLYRLVWFPVLGMMAAASCYQAQCYDVFGRTVNNGKRKRKQRLGSKFQRSPKQLNRDASLDTDGGKWLAGPGATDAECRSSM